MLAQSLPTSPLYTPLEVLRDRWWLVLIAFGVSLVCTPIVRLIAYKSKVVDRPDDLLKPHGKPIAYLGGVAMCAGLLAGLAGYLAVMPDRLDGTSNWEHLRASLSAVDVCELPKNPVWNLLGIALGCVVITIVGLLDDVRNISPRKKVLGQVLAAVILMGGGVGDRMAMVLFTGVLPLIHVEPAWWVLYPLSAAMCVVMVVAVCNATNLLDGLDGLCGGVTGIVALGFLVLAVFLAQWGRFPGTDELRVGLCLAMLGAVLGFLPYNIPPASIFMGDAGSMLLGFFVAAMMALFCQEGNARWFVASCAVFALPILDTALAVVRRVRARVNIFAGDRSHLYDQLVDRGMSIKQVVVLFYVLAAVAAGIGTTVAVFVRTRYAVILYAVLLTGIWVTFAKLGMVTPPPRRSSHDRPDAPGGEG